MWNVLIPAVTAILDKVIPDPQAAADAKLKALQLAQTGELAELTAVKELALAQLEVNKAEAASSSPYVSGWRPTIGYVLAAALCFQYIINPLILWGAAIAGSSITPPDIQIDEHMWELIFGVLGLAGWRSFDKRNGKG